MKRQLRLSEYAKKMGVCYKTAHNWWKDGKLPNAYATETGSIFVKDTDDVDEIKQIPKESRVVVYTRVSNQSRKDELQYQIKRCLDFCAANGYAVCDTYHEIASGMNDSRKKLWEMINSKPTMIVIENKDRLTRFGFRYLNDLLLNQNCKIVVINDNDNDEQDLMKDMISIVTSFCCRLYGLRRTKNRIDKIKSLVSDIKEAK